MVTLPYHGRVNIPSGSDLPIIIIIINLFIHVITTETHVQIFAIKILYGLSKKMINIYTNI